MLTDPKPRSQVDALWDKFWAGGRTNALSLQEEFASFVSLRGSATGMVARVESLRGWMGESERQVEGLFESLLHEAFKG